MAAPQQAHFKKVIKPEQVPFAGFPEGITPRPGDLVTVTDNWDGFAVAAVPVVHWLVGKPKKLSDGAYEVAGERVVASPLLEAQKSKRVRVCVLDTELPEAQVMAVQAA